MCHSVLEFDLNNISENKQKTTKVWKANPQELKSPTLKVSKFQNELMKSSFLPKYEPNIVRISALCTVPHYRAEIHTIFGSYCGRNDNFINSFWHLLTFSQLWTWKVLHWWSKLTILKFIFSLKVQLFWEGHKNDD